VGGVTVQDNPQVYLIQSLIEAVACSIVDRKVGLSGRNRLLTLLSCQCKFN
jgi:hypothetical protein